MNCPMCSEAMSGKQDGVYADIPLHECENCAFIFLSASSLNRLDDNIVLEVTQLQWERAPTGEREPPCPRCRLMGGYREGGEAAMQRLRSKGRPDLALHNCRRCDGWLLGPQDLELVRALAAIS